MKKAITKSYCMRLNVEKDADVIRKLEEVPKIQTYIKRLVRADLAGLTTPLTTSSEPKKA